MSDLVSKNELTIQVCDDQDIRLDLFLAGKVEILSRSKIHGLILSGEVRVNGAQTKPSHRLKSYDTVTIKIPPPQALEVIPEKMPLTLVYEDDFYLAVNKPSGLVVHPGAGDFHGTLVSGLLNYTEHLSSVGGEMRPGLVHRLDKDTSGVLIVAKTDEAHWKLGKLFSDRRIYKEYRALVWGVPSPESGVIEAALGRDPRNRKKITVSDKGKFARSRYELIESYEIISHVKVIIETGRTHQIRVHMLSIGHPVVGDKTYGGGKRSFCSFEKKYLDLGNQVIARAGRQMLHAYCIRFRHPILDKDIEIVAPLASDFVEITELLQKHRV
ncbi:MAG: RluA family pseudouridine synthase [Candidatus Marinimicrobia bacterium]|nr:RluA family pseudouridine synthase [Candidatus Neomarinimicrobiota bacterium]